MKKTSDIATGRRSFVWAALALAGFGTAAAAAERQYNDECVKSARNADR